MFIGYKANPNLKRRDTIKKPKTIIIKAFDMDIDNEIL